MKRMYYLTYTYQSGHEENALFEYTYKAGVGT
jgi:hypothetical protein